MVTLDRSWLVVLVVMAVVCLCVGCAETGNSGAPVLQAVPLGASNGYVLIQHPNGKLYTIKLEDGEALEIWNMPDIGKR